MLLRRAAAGNAAWNPIVQAFGKVQANAHPIVANQASAAHAARGFAAQAAPAASGVASGSITQVRGGVQHLNTTLTKTRVSHVGNTTSLDA